jgi:hypothetical protein
MGWACSTYGERGVFGGEIVGKDPLGRPRLRWEDNIKMDLQEMEWGLVLDWSDSG